MKLCIKQEVFFINESYTVGLIALLLDLMLLKYCRFTGNFFICFKGQGFYQTLFFFVLKFSHQENRIANFLKNLPHMQHPKCTVRGRTKVWMLLPLDLLHRLKDWLRFNMGIKPKTFCQQNFAGSSESAFWTLWKDPLSYESSWDACLGKEGFHFSPAHTAPVTPVSPTLHGPYFWALWSRCSPLMYLPLIHSYVGLPHQVISYSALDEVSPPLRRTEVSMLTASCNPSYLSCSRQTSVIEIQLAIQSFLRFFSSFPNKSLLCYISADEFFPSCM